MHFFLNFLSWDPKINLFEFNQLVLVFGHLLFFFHLCLLVFFIQYFCPSNCYQHVIFFEILPPIFSPILNFTADFATNHMRFTHPDIHLHAHRKLVHCFPIIDPSAFAQLCQQHFGLQRQIWYRRRHFSWLCR